jgi:hypothetical protein
MNARKRSPAAHHDPCIGSRVDSVLRSLGVDPQFADHVLGDLAEELAVREANGGAIAARLWYTGEVARSIPHLLRSAVRHGSPAQRARLIAVAGGLSLAIALTTAAILTRVGPPARLLPDHGEGRLVINNVTAMQFPVRVVDAAGRRLPSDSVRFALDGGSAATISRTGAITCLERGDAAVRASLGTISTVIGVRCLPVKQIASGSWVTLIAGEHARHLPFKAIGIDGEVVAELRGSVVVSDSSVATVVGTDVVPRAVGTTRVNVAIGDESASIRILVYEKVSGFDQLRPDQRLVAVPVRVAQGESVEWKLPTGGFWLRYTPRHAGDAPPTIVADGNALCQVFSPLRTYFVGPDEYGTYCLSRGGPAVVRVSHGYVGKPVVEGWLAFERGERQ